MFGLKQFFKKLLKDDPKKVKHKVAVEDLRNAFTNRYLNFKTLLSTNNKVLELITDMEQTFSGSRTFGMSFIRANCTAISVNIYKIISCLNEIANDKYKELPRVLEDILLKIDRELQQKKLETGGELILLLEGIDKTMADHVGAKMANLGEVKNALGLPVPEGFVITAAAHECFMEYGDLQDEINRRIQFLEPTNIARLHETSSDIQNLIITAPCPPEIEDAILNAYTDLMEKAGHGFHVSMRSSALGEDTRDASFAGQYRSVLNVSRENLILSYKEVLAGKYSVPAVSYRLNKGFRDEDIIMCVGCMTMVDAEAGGVMYSADPGNIRHECIIINAAWGLGKSVVDGSMAHDLFVLSKKDPKIILKSEISDKKQQLVSGALEGICLANITEEQANKPAITDEQAALLGELALRLEKHFGAPQDIEWAFEPDGSVSILQSRPLMVLDKEPTGIKDIPEPKVDLPVILTGGVAASPGAASGPAFVVETAVDMLQFPPGAVLVARNPLPKWAALLNSAVAVITDTGGVTGHMAAVAREFKVPALFGTSTATEYIRNGDLVTVDATGCAVYAGRAESLLEKEAEKTSLMKGSPVHNSLGNVLKYIAPLNLTDPDASDFTPEGCRTIHDIIRFAHEMSLCELFEFKKDASFPEHLARRLVIDVPMQWWVVDLGGGCREGTGGGGTIGLEDITSGPMLTLWKGITAIPWKGPPPIDTKGFFSVMYGATMDRSLVPGIRSRYADRNYFIISGNFCHLSSRFGFHFSTVEAFFGDKVAENYICFNFNGGGADNVRRQRRANLIKLILEKFDFWVQIKGDTVFARLERQEIPFLKERLKVLGHLVMHTRQLDMVLSNSGRVNKYVEKILKEVSSFVDVSQ
ncbi:MAG TPA: PEP/pyruvate-binding domain-containing protein [Anaerolineae bacterium]|nr:PEP/pyruvate-binding domain-containing protein [Anaerolineae bacterium]